MGAGREGGGAGWGVVRTNTPETQESKYNLFLTKPYQKEQKPKQKENTIVGKFNKVLAKLT